MDAMRNAPETAHTDEKIKRLRIAFYSSSEKIGNYKFGPQGLKTGAFFGLF